VDSMLLKGLQLSAAICHLSARFGVWLHLDCPGPTQPVDIGPHPGHRHARAFAVGLGTPRSPSSVRTAGDYVMHQVPRISAVLDRRMSALPSPSVASVGCRRRRPKLPR
jgi:hypothetical protein